MSWRAPGTLCTVGRSFEGWRGSDAGVTQCRQAWEVHPPLPIEQLSFLLSWESCKLQEHCSSHIITAQLCSSCIHCPAASTASQSLQGSGARLQGALGFKQFFWGNLIPRSAASSLYCASCCTVPSPGSFPGHGHYREPGREKPWCDIFHGALVPPALLPPAPS